MNNWYTIRAQAMGAEVVIYDEISLLDSLMLFAMPIHHSPLTE